MGIARALPRSLSAVLAVCVPVALLGNALWLLLGPWLVDLAYVLPGFPADPGGLERAQRAELADTGLRAVRPLGEGVGVLREAELPDGRSAFGPAEIRHMADVRALVAGMLAAWAACVVVGLAAGAWLRRSAGSAAVLWSLRLGALATLTAIAAIGLFALVAFDAFFTAFHGVFFEGDTWRFSDGATLRRLYPDAFWSLASAAMVALVVLQAVALAVLPGRLWQRLDARPTQASSG